MGSCTWHIETSTRNRSLQSLPCQEIMYGGCVGQELSEVREEHDSTREASTRASFVGRGMT